MYYVCAAFGTLWLAVFGYLFILGRQVKDMGRRLDARLASQDE
ncbi:MAG: CcmD family protein [Anaerohalosphaera sp.]|nr:CcmD family protein [Anaerohalosphaera sp.]